MKLDFTKTIENPQAAHWAAWKQLWFWPLVRMLGRSYSKGEREDAVSVAFMKAMSGPGRLSGSGKPSTEGNWFKWLLWQAKAHLSHEEEAEKRRAKVHRLAALEGAEATVAVVRGEPPSGMDAETVRWAAFATLYSLSEEAGFKSSNVEAYVRWYLNGEDSKVVARELGMTVGGLHVARKRLEELLAEKGPRRFNRFRAQGGHHAA